jgi:flavin reductase (DIM6/NTAB) family NADH-FMN oxidoreductase RutF
VGCELGDAHQGGDHVIVTGLVTDLEAGEGKPLMFFGGEYRAFDG